MQSHFDEPCSSNYTPSKKRKLSNDLIEDDSNDEVNDTSYFHINKK